MCADDDCRKYLDRQKELPVQVPEVDSRHLDRGITINDGVSFQRSSMICFWCLIIWTSPDFTVLRNVQCSDKTDVGFV